MPTALLLDQIVEKDEVVGSGAGRQRHQAREGRGTVSTPSDGGPELPLRLRRSSRARQSALLSTRGKGCAGSMVMGVSSGSTSR